MVSPSASKRQASPTKFGAIYRVWFPAIPQGCSVIANSDVIKGIIKVHTVAKKFEADIFNIVLSQNIDSKTS